MFIATAAPGISTSPPSTLPRYSAHALRAALRVSQQVQHNFALDGGVVLRKSSEDVPAPLKLHRSVPMTPEARPLLAFRGNSAHSSGFWWGRGGAAYFGGELTVMFLGKTYQEFGPRLQADSIVVIRGRVNHRDDGITLQAMTLQTPDFGVASETGPLVLSLREQRATVDVVTELEAVLRRHRGSTEVRLRLVRDEAARVFELPHRIEPTAGFFGEVKSLLAPRALA